MSETTRTTKVAIEKPDGSRFSNNEYAALIELLLDVFGPPVERRMKVALDRDLLEELPDECYAVFEGEWGPPDSGEPEGWETFRVMLLGTEAGDYADATIEDLRRIVAAFDSPEVAEHLKGTP